MTSPMPRSKKDLEGAYLMRFRAAIQDFPVGRVDPTEEPDFLVIGPDSVVGIELTELHRDSVAGAIPQQASEAMRKRVVARAQEIYVAGGHPPARVTLYLDDTIHVERQDVERFAVMLCDVAIQNLPLPNASSQVSIGMPGSSAFPPILCSVTVHRLDVITRTHFNNPGGTWVAPIEVTDVERALASKEEKCATYRKRCDVVWLLVNAEIESMSTWFDPDSGVLAAPYKTSFDRVFVMFHFSNRVVELVRQ